MADKQYGWLDAETAERLLRGESLDNAVDAAAQDEAERLAKTLGALSVESPSNGAELPGEAAALAAFRDARAERTTSAAPGRSSVSDAGLIRIGAPAHSAPRPRRRRPARFGLAAALAFGMVGGVTVAAATGMLPTPFGDDGPRPGATVSAAVTPDRPLSSPSPDDTGEAEPTPEGSPSGSPDAGAPRTDAGGAPSTDPGSDPGGRRDSFGSRWDGAASACRDLRDGKKLSADRRRALEKLAGGSGHVWTYCKDVLKSGDGQAGRDDGHQDRDSNQDQDDKGGPGGQDGDDDSHHGAPGGGHNHHRQNGGFTTSSPSPSADDTTVPSKRAATAPGPSPNPSSSAL